MEQHRLRWRLFWVDVRARRFGEVWLASADTPEGLTIGTGESQRDAVFAALESFASVRHELLAKGAAKLARVRPSGEPRTRDGEGRLCRLVWGSLPPGRVDLLQPELLELDRVQPRCRGHLRG